MNDDLQQKRCRVGVTFLCAFNFVSFEYYSVVTTTSEGDWTNTVRANSHDDAT